MGITWSLPHIEGSPRDSPRPTSPASPSTTLSTPQGAGLRGPAASSNSSYVPCHQLLCASRLSAPARHIRSYPFWVKDVARAETLRGKWFHMADVQSPFRRSMRGALQAESSLQPLLCHRLPVPEDSMPMQGLNQDGPFEMHCSLVRVAHPHAGMVGITTI